MEARTSPTVMPDAAHPRRTVTVRVASVVLAGYGILLAAIAFWPVPVDRGAGRLLHAITAAVPWLTYPRIEFGANILLFVPLGVLLAVLLRRRWVLGVPVAFLLSALIELGQGVFLAERTSSAMDIVANTLGGAIGVAVGVVVNMRHGRNTGDT